jgi:cyclopropane fatty-acyl-phospholipid synthase-like methyltransferase
MTAAPESWVSYWEELSEGQLLFRQEAEECVRRLTQALPLSPGAVVLDFGCGSGFIAEGLAPLVGTIYLWDAAESMRRHAVRRLRGVANVRPLERLESPPGVCFDLILVNSVVQYMTEVELADWLGRWQSLLAPSGRVVLSDLIPPDHRSLSDVLSLLRFSLGRGYFCRALRNVLGERKRYQQTVRAHPLLHVGRDQLTQLAQAAGLTARFLPRNLTHFAKRYTAVLGRRP